MQRHDANVRHYDRSSNLTAPETPAGFSIEFVFVQDTPLNGLQMYANMIELIGYWALLPYHDIMRQVFRMTNDVFNMQITVVPTQPSRLHFYEAIAGLYQAGTSIAANNLFYKGLVIMRNDEDQIGYLDYNVKAVATNDIRELSQNVSVSTPPVPDQGTIIDPEDMSMRATYRYNGAKFLARDVFTAFLDGLANIAPNDKDAMCTQFSAISTSRRCSMVVTGENEVGNRGLTWGRLAVALVFIWEQLLSGQPIGRRPRFEGLDFTIEYAGQLIGRGSLVKLSPSGEVAVS